MKKNSFINKYDFINYFTKQPSLWFFSNAEIYAGIELELQKYKIDLDYDLDDEEGEIDTSDIEYDNFDYYKELVQQNMDIDLNNPRIQEGVILDNKSRDFIKQHFKHIQNVVDLDTLDINHFDLHLMAQKTKEFLLENEHIILFQSVFIHENIITKPDAIIKDGTSIILIETKGTTTAKKHHALDIYFQAQVLRRNSYLDDFDLNFRLCLAAYDYAAKYDATFIITDTFNYTKTISLSKLTSVSQKQAAKIGKKTSKHNNDVFLFFDNVCFDSLQDFENRLEVESSHVAVTALKKSMDNFKDVFDNFDAIVAKLLTHLKAMQQHNELICKDILPHQNEKNIWKTNDLFMLLKKLHLVQGYELFKFSGNFVDMSSENLKNLPKVVNPMDYVRFETKRDVMEIFLESNKRPIVINQQASNNLLSRLKDKKVYFDFETINTAIRVLDNTLPFMQIVTQCSIVIDHHDGTNVDKLSCNNILIDPRNIRIDDYKMIVDALYRGNDYSYVVYNISFERSRLKEFIEFINDPSYTEKINCIINNLFDLADFFRYTKSIKSIPILIKELGGYFSIKKVLPYIQKNYNDIYAKTGCLNYDDLVIKNGVICQNETTLHFLSSQPDYDKWNNLSNEMKTYCENDVRAMIAVELFVKELLLKSNW